MNFILKKRLIGILLAGLLLAGCQNTSNIFLMEQVLESAIAFDFDSSATQIPDQLVDTFSNYKVLLMGEMHYVKEHQVFMGNLLKRLHDEGFRYYLQENGSANTVLVDYYLKGNLDVLPPSVKNFDKAFIELIHDFNKNLRDHGREDEQISYIGFDMNHYSDAYFIAILTLSEHYDSSELKRFRVDLRDLPENPRAYKALLTDFLDNVYALDLTGDQIETLRMLTQNELDSLAIRLDWDDDAREAYIEKEVIRAVELSSDDEKLIVNCGAWHAQLIPYWVMSNDKEFQWLGMRLKNYFDDRDDDFYSLTVTAYEGERKRNIWSSERFTFELSGRQAGINVVKGFKNAFGDQYVFLNYKKLAGVEDEILIEYPTNMVKMEPNIHFNGLLVYPQVTVPEELSYYE